MSLFGRLKVKFNATRDINLVLAIGTLLYYGVMAMTAATAALVDAMRKLRQREDYWESIERPDSDVALDKRE